MCGRFALFSDSEILARRFGAQLPLDFQPHYNIAPSQTIPIVRHENGRRFALARWGLIPRWAKSVDTGYSTINARAETVAVKPAYRASFRGRRCLIPADGFYEWQTVPGSKIKRPHFVALRERTPMALAGLWERWENPEGGALESCTIIVTGANDLMRPIHDRMPVILAPSNWDHWLDPDTRDLNALQDLLKPFPSEQMIAWPVSTRVNNPRHDEPDCLAAAATPGPDSAID